MSSELVGPRVIVVKSLTCKGCPALSKVRQEEMDQDGSINVWYQYYCTATKYARELAYKEGETTPWWCPSKLQILPDGSTEPK